jgi:phosphoglucomutase
MQVDLSKLGTQLMEGLTIEIVDPIVDYVELMKEIFDFGGIKQFLSSNPSFTFLFDAMHAVTGPYAKQLFVTELGFPTSSVINAVPSEDFNGGHPDPNLTYAHELVELVEKNNISFGAASGMRL